MLCLLPRRPARVQEVSELECFRALLGALAGQGEVWILGAEPHPHAVLQSGQLEPHGDLELLLCLFLENRATTVRLQRAEPALRRHMAVWL